MQILRNLFIAIALTGSITTKPIENIIDSKFSIAIRTNFNYNGEKDPNYDQIDSDDWYTWCDINSIYARPTDGYKNRYRSEKPEYNFGICPIVFDDPIVQLAGRGYTNAVLTAGGEVYAWGRGASGQLGQGDTDYRLIPTKVSGLKDISMISASNSSILALDKYGRVWGAGSSLANGTGVEQLTTAMTNLENIISIASGDHHNMALTSSGEIWSWGDASGIIGNGKKVDVPIPTNISNLIESPLYGKKIKQISAGWQSGMAVDVNGNAYIWGSNKDGKLGLGADSAVRTWPIEIHAVKNVSEVYAAGGASFLKTTAGKVYGTGKGNQGNQLGLGNDIPQYTWVELPWLQDSKSISALHVTFAVDKDDRIIAVGQNNNGEIGVGDTYNRYAPIELDWKKVVTINNSDNATFYLDATGAVYATGNNIKNNDEGLLGINLPGKTPTGGETNIDAVGSVNSPIKIIQSQPSYTAIVQGQVSAMSNDNYKFIYTTQHPNKASALAASPIHLTSQKTTSERFDPASTITNDDYTTSNDYYFPSIGGEICNDSGICKNIPEMRDPDQDLNGPNFNEGDPDYNGGLPEEYLIASVKPVTLSSFESGDASSEGIKVPINYGSTSSAQHVYVNKLEQKENNLVILIEVYKIEKNGMEVLIKTQEYREIGNFVIKTSDLRDGNDRAKIRFRSYLDIDANKEGGKIQYYSAERYFISTKPYTGNFSMPVWLIILISAIIVVAGAGVGIWFIKTRRGPARY